jgi:hypothetical protein
MLAAQIERMGERECPEAVSIGLRALPKSSEAIWTVHWLFSKLALFDFLSHPKNGRDMGFSSHLSGRGYNSKLLYHAKHVNLSPSLHDLAAGEMIDDNRAHLNLFVSGGNVHEIAFVSAACNKAVHFFVSFGNLVLKIDVKVRESGANHGDILFEPFGALDSSIFKILPQYSVRRDDFIQSIQAIAGLLLET